MTPPTATDARTRVLRQLAQLCADKGIRNFIVAPGSRSAPLTAALAEQPQLTCRAVYDERSAGYLALGLAQQSGQPTGLVCTSGTAALNFAPAVAEAFYQQIPLLILTADRPPEWIDQQDNQAIHQRDLYAPHCQASYELPVDYAHPDAVWHALRTISEAIDRTRGLTPGPVHVDVPLREPLYPAADAATGVDRAAQSVSPSRLLPGQIDRLLAAPQLAPDAWDRLLAAWHTADAKLVVAGLHPPDDKLSQSLAQLNQRPDVAVLADITANLAEEAAPLARWDAVLGTGDQARLDRLRPDLVVSFGGPLVSKHLRQLLRSRPPQAQWHIHPAGNAPDTYQCLTQAVPMRPAAFFAQLAGRLADAQPPKPSSYAAEWRRFEAAAGRTVGEFLEHADFGEFQALYRVMQALPSGSRVQVGNSMPIRYANFVGRKAGPTLDRVDSNRGVSGIDGTVSTAVGAALATSRLTTLLVGDLAFFYDRNGLWHQHVPANLRVVVFNNHGGGIFDLIDGPSRLPRALQETFFLARHPLTARRTAADHGLGYFHASDAATLRAALAEFFAPQPRAAILEIESDMGVNSQVFRSFKELLAGLA